MNRIGTRQVSIEMLNGFEHSSSIIACVYELKKIEVYSVIMDGEICTQYCVTQKNLDGVIIHQLNTVNLEEAVIYYNKLNKKTMMGEVVNKTVAASYAHLN